MIKYTELSDMELHSLAMVGSTEAEDELVARYIHLPRAIVHRYNLILLGGDNEDLVQEGTIGLISAIRSYDPACGSQFSTHAYTCIESRLLSAVRSAARKKHNPLNNGLSLEYMYDGREIPLFNSESTDPEKQILAQENLNELFELISKHLSKAENRVLTLYLEGCTYRNIAAKLGKNTKYVDNAVQRIRRKLSRAIQSGDVSSADHK